jgi:hypothetical protein
MVIAPFEEGEVDIAAIVAARSTHRDGGEPPFRTVRASICRCLLSEAR